MRTVWTVAAFEGLQGLERLEQDWRRLVTEMPEHGPQHHYENAKAYFSCLSKQHGLVTLLALSDGAQIRAIVPMERGDLVAFKQTFSAWGLSWQMFDFNRDLICPPGEAQQALLPAVLRWLRAESADQPPWLVFDWVLDGSAASRCVDNLPAGLAFIDQFEPSAMFLCETTYSEFESRLSRKFRANLRSAHRRLACMEGVRFVSVSDPAGLARAFREFLVVESSGWKGTTGTRSAICLKPEQQAYYHALVDSAPTGSGCEFNAIYMGEECIASALCFRGGTDYAIPKIGYDQRHAQASPGHLLLEWILKRCMDDPQIRRVNMVSNAAWLEPWQPERVRNLRVVIGFGAWSGPWRTWLFRMGTLWVPRIKHLVSRLRSRAAALNG